MRNRVVLLAAALTTVATASFGHGNALLKCSANEPVLFPDAPDPVYVFNGAAVSAEQFDVLKRDPKVESVEIVCATELYRALGIKARRNAVVVFTSPGPHSTLENAMKTIERLQRDHLTREGTFAASLSDLGWSDPSGMLTVDLVRSPDGSRWSATGSHQHLLTAAMKITISGERTRDPK